jgi:hypothetical protein
LARAREDLEGMRSLLAAVAGSPELDRVLADVDRRGRALRLTTLAGFHLEDERLARVAIIDPTAWWAIPSKSVQSI